MVGEHVVEHTPIKRENLDYNQYTLSLLREVYRVGLINEQMLSRLQSQIMSILQDLILRYTQGESTSVAIETAENILISIYYCLDVYLSRFNNPLDSLDVLMNRNTKDIYEQSIKHIKNSVEETRLLYEEVVRNKLEIPLKLYNETLEDALPGFFMNYGVIFNAHDTMSSMDYPLMFDDMSIRGILYIKQYLEKLRIENRFCRLFRKEDILRLLENYGRVYDFDYKESPINLFEILINNSIFSVMIEGDTRRLVLSQLHYEVLGRLFEDLKPSKITSIVDEVFEKLIENLLIYDSKLIEYINRYKVIFMPRVLNAVENGNLKYLIITGDEEELGKGSIVFKDGYKMDDESFRSVVDRIVKCNNVKEKINIITSKIHSMRDFVDLLSADCLFGDEFSAVFNTMSDMELAILGWIVFREELRIGPITLLESLHRIVDIDEEWHAQYFRFIGQLNTERINLIEVFINGKNTDYNDISF